MVDELDRVIKHSNGEPVMRWVESDSVDRSEYPSKLTSSIKTTRKRIEIGLGAD